MISFMEFGKPLQDSCDLTGCSFGMTVVPHGGIPRQAQMHELICRKAPDYLTGVLLQYCGDGKHIDAVALKVYRSEDSGEPIVTYIMKDVFIVTAYVGGAGQDDVFALSFKTMTYTSVPDSAR